MNDENDRDDFPTAELARYINENGLFDGNQAFQIGRWVWERARGRAAEPQGREFWIVDQDIGNGETLVRGTYLASGAPPSCADEKHWAGKFIHVREVPKPRPDVFNEVAELYSKAAAKRGWDAQPPASDATSRDDSESVEAQSAPLLTSDKTAYEAFRFEFFEWLTSMEGYESREDCADWGRDYGKRESAAEIAAFDRDGMKALKQMHNRIAELEAELAKLKQPKEKQNGT